MLRRIAEAVNDKVKLQQATERKGVLDRARATKLAHGQLIRH